MSSSDVSSQDEPEVADPAASGEAVEETQKLSLEVKVDQTSACERHITVTVSAEDVERYFTEAVSELMPTASVPGFRPGKAPRKLVENRFRKDVSAQVKGSLVMDSIAQVSDEQELSAIGEPDFEYEAVELPEEGPMTFEFDLEVRPDFTMPQWKGLVLEKPVRQHTTQDVDEHLKRILSKHAEMVDKDGAAAKGDYVTVDITFAEGEREVSKLEDETVCVRPVLSFFDGKLQGFDTLMVGANVGDTREGSIKLSLDAEDEALRGKQLSVKFKVTEVQELQLPELDEAMLDRLGDFDNEGDLRDAVGEHLGRQLAYQQNQRIRGQIADLLTESADWDLPPDLLRRQSQRELQRAVMELQSAGYSEDEIRAHEADLRQNSQESTAKALKEHFILERIAEDESIDVETGDYDAEIELIAAQSGGNPRRVRARLEKDGLMDTLRNQIIERKAVKLITDNAQFNEVPYEGEQQLTETVDHFIGGAPVEEIPEAKFDEQSQPRQATDRK